MRPTTGTILLAFMAGAASVAARGQGSKAANYYTVPGGSDDCDKTTTATPTTTFATHTRPAALTEGEAGPLPPSNAPGFTSGEHATPYPTTFTHKAEYTSTECSEEYSTLATSTHPTAFWQTPRSNAPGFTSGEHATPYPTTFTNEHEFSATTKCSEAKTTLITSTLAAAFTEGEAGPLPPSNAPGFVVGEHATPYSTIPETKPTEDCSDVKTSFARSTSHVTSYLTESVPTGAYGDALPTTTDCT